MAFPVLIFAKLTNAVQHLVLISYTEFHLNLKINMWCMDRNSFKSSKKVWLSQDHISRMLHHTINLYGHLYKILSKLDKNVDNKGKNFMYAKCTNFFVTHKRQIRTAAIKKYGK